MKFRLALVLLCASSSLLAQDPRQRLLDDLIRKEGAPVRDEAEAPTLRAPGACTTTDAISNGGFEAGYGSSSSGCSGTSSGWSWTSSDCLLSPIWRNQTTQVARSGVWAIYFNPFGPVTQTLTQRVTIPAGATASLSFWYAIGTFEVGSTVRDTLALEVRDTLGGTLSSPVTYSNANNTSLTYRNRTVDLGAYAGQTVDLRFTARQDSILETLFWLDDISLSITKCDPSGGNCVSNANTACFLDGRFKATGTYNLESGATGALTFGPNLTTQSAPMYFENLADPQALVKVIPACFAPFNRYWVFIGALTNQGASLTVTDTARNVSKTYINSRGNVWSPIQDTSAFDTCP